MRIHTCHCFRWNTTGQLVQVMGTTWKTFPVTFHLFHQDFLLLLESPQCHDGVKCFSLCFEIHIIWNAFMTKIQREWTGLVRWRLQPQPSKLLLPNIPHQASEYIQYYGSYSLYVRFVGSSQKTVHTNVLELPWPCCILRQDVVHAQGFCAGSHCVVPLHNRRQDLCLLPDLCSDLCTSLVPVIISVEAQRPSLDAGHQHLYTAAQGIWVISSCFCR